MSYNVRLGATRVTPSGFLILSDTAPTTRDNGSNLQTGDVWYNNTTQAFSYYVESGWSAPVNTTDVQTLPVSTFNNDTGYITAAHVPVTSVNGETGDVVLDATDVGALQSGDNISQLVNDAGYVTAAGGTIAQSQVTDLESDLSLKADLVNGTIPTSQLPALAITEFLGVAANEAEMTALNGQPGDWCLRTDVSIGFVIIAGDGSDAAYWQAFTIPGSAVTSLQGQVGDVVLAPEDIGAATNVQGSKADTALQPSDINVSVQPYDVNTVIDALYVRTERSFTNAEHTKLANIEVGAEANVNADWNATSGDELILNKPTLGSAAATDSTDYATAAQGTAADSALQPADIGVTVQGFDADIVIDANYVATDENFTTADHAKLDGIEAGAEVNVLADWNAIAGDAFILNKPDLGSAALLDSTDFATAAQGSLADSSIQPADIGVSVQGFDADTVVDALYVRTDENFTTADHAKLDGIEAGATADQTAAEIKTAYESNADTNVFDDAAANKLSGVEVGAAADQTGAEIKALYEAENDTNVFDDAAVTKLAGIEAGATGDQTSAEIKAAYESNTNTNAFTDLEQIKLAQIEAGAEVNVDTNLSYSQSTNELASSTGTNVILPLAGALTNEDGLMSHEDKAKLDGIEAGATADQTAAEIKSLYEGEADTNAFTDAEQTKLAGIEAGATGDQTAAEIKTAYESNLDTNVFDDAAVTKLAGIEAGATGDQTGAEIKALYEAEADTNAFDDAAVTKLAGIEAGATGDQTAAEIKTAYESNLDTNAFTDADHTKLDGIEANATADQTDAEIKTAYENNLDTNAFTDAEKSKLSGIAAGAEVNVDTNLSYDASTRELASSTGTDVTLPLAVAGGNAGLLEGSDKTQLDSLATDLAGKADLSGGKLLTSQLPDLAITEYLGQVSNETGMLALSGEQGDWAIRLDDGKVYVITGSNPSLASNWTALNYPVASGTNLSYDSSTRTVASSNGTDATIPLVVSGGIAGLITGSDKSKLDGIEAGATGDQTAAEIKTAYESNADTNAFTDAEQTKLSGIEAGATGDQTGAEIKSLYESQSNTNAFTDADHSKLDGIEAGATGDQTAAEIKSLYESNLDTNEFTDAEKSKLSGIAAGAEVNVQANWNATSGDAFIQNKPTLGTAAATDSTDYATAAQGTTADSAIQPTDSIDELADVDTTTVAPTAGQVLMWDNTNSVWNPGTVAVGNGTTNLAYTASATNGIVSSDTGTNATIPLAGNVEAGLMSPTNFSKLSNIEDNATADQTGAEIKIAYESQTNTNAFTDADHNKLDGIESGAQVNVATNLGYTQSTNLLSSSTGTNVTLPVAGALTNQDGLMSHEDKAKLDGLEAGATGDQTGAEIKSLYEGEADTNAFTDADHTKLDGIEAGAEVNVDTNLSYTQSTNELASSTGTNVTLPLAGAETDEDGLMSHEDKAKLDGIETAATADQTGAEIKSLYEAEADTNAFDDAAVAKLAGIEANATADQTAAEIKTAYESNLDTNAFTDADESKLDGIEAGAQVNVAANLSYTQSSNELSSSTGNTVTLPLAGALTDEDGLMSHEDKAKLDGIEAGATADQTGAEIKALYEAEADTNAFTDADHTKLDGIEAGATGDQTDAEIKTAYENNLDTNAFTDADHTKLDGIEDGAQVNVPANLSYTQSTNELASSTGTNVTLPLAGDAVNEDGLMSHEDKAKLDLIEAGATADQSASEIKSLYESNADTNAFTDADEAKLDGIEANATADQTAAEIKTAYESNLDTNAFTDADHTKLDGIEAGAQVNVAANLSYTQSTNELASSTGTNVTLPLAGALTDEDGLMSHEDKAKLDGIEAGATADQTGAEIKALYEGEADTNAFDDAAVAKLAGIEANATADQTDAEIKTAYENNLDTNVFDDAAVAKLAGIETAATADQTGAEIKALYEAEADTNAFTDADESKLDGIEAGAQVNVAADLSYTSGTRELASSTGTNVTLPLAVAGGDAGLLTGADKTQLDSLATDLAGKADLSGGKLLTSQLPDLAITEFLGEVANETAMLALTGEEGDWAIRTDDSKVYVITGSDPSVAANWTALSYPVPADTNLSYTSGTRELASSTGTNVTLPLVVAGGDAGLQSGADKSKLDGIEAGATADQTDAEIKTAYENNADTNAFTDAEQTKLAGIETAATADQTGAEIKALYEAEDDTNAFDDAAVAKLAGIEANATADQTAAEIKTAYESNLDTNAFTDADHTKLDGIEAGAQVNVAADLSYTQSTNELASSTGTNVTLPLAGAAADEDGLMSHEDKAKLDGIEAGATADQTGAEIKSLYESQTNTNAFTDADVTKLDGIEDNATADQTAAEIKTAYESNLDTNAFTDADHTKLDGIEAGAQVNVAADLSYTQSTNELASSTGTNVTLPLAGDSVDEDGLMSHEDKAKLDGIEAGATADQSASEIKTAYESNADTNAFDDAAVSKLAGIEANATADQTAAEIKTAYESNLDTNAFTDADHTKLDGIEAGAQVNVAANLSYTQSSNELASSTGTNVTLPLAGDSVNEDGLMSHEDKAKLDGIEAGATADQTGAEIKSLYESQTNTNAFTDADTTKLDGIEAGAQVNVAADLSYTQSTNELASSTGTNVTLPLAGDSLDQDGLMSHEDKAKLDGIEAGATADQTGAEIKTAYEAEADTNAFTDAEKSKLAAIAAGAEVNVDTDLSYTQSTNELASSTGTNVTLPLAGALTNEDGLMSHEDKAKLDGIETGATADQTAAEIKTAYESNSDTNAFDDAAVAKLAGIESAATADQTGAEIKALYEAELDTNAFTDADHTKLDGIEAGAQVNVAADLSYTQSTNELASSTGTNVTLPLAGTTADTDGLMSHEDKSKLDGIAAGAEVNVDTNLSYTQSTNELASSTGTNVTLPLAGAATDEDGLMSHEDKAKLDGIEAGATADQTGAEIKTAYEAEADTNAFTDAEKTKLSGIAAGAEVNVDTNLTYTQSTNELASSTGTNVTLPLAGALTDEDGLMSHEDKAKLDGIESAATADQTGAEIKSLYEAEADTNAFTDADHTKLDGIEAGAQVNVAADLSYTSGTRELASSTGTNVTLPLAVAGGDAGLLTGADKTQLDNLTTNLDGKADLSGGKLLTSQLPDLAITEYLGQAANETAMLALTGQEGDWAIRTDDSKVYVITGSDPSVAANWTALSYPVAADTNLTYTSSTRVLASSTGTDATIPLVVAAGDAGLMTGADKTKLDGIETAATADQTGAEIKSLYEGELDTNAFTDADHTKLDGIEAGAQVNVAADLSYTQSTNELASSTGTNVTLPLAGAATDEDGLMSHEDKAKLDGIEANATADQTDAEIKTAYENNADTNAFTDAEQTKLSGIEAGAQVNVAADLSYTQSTNELASSTGTNVTLPLAGTTADTDGLMSHEDKAKLDGIATGAEVNVDTNLSYTQSTNELASSTGTNVTLPLAGAATDEDGLMSHEDKSKLDGIEAGAQVNVAADLSYTQSTNELASSTGTNVTLPLAGAATNEDGLMSHEDKAKLDGIETGATADQTGAEIKSLYEAENDTNAFDDAAVAKLAGIEASATADQTGAEIKALYEAELDTNAFTDADHTKLDGIAAGAEVNVNADWNATTGDAEILNKPTLGTAAATDSTAYATAAQGALADSATQPGDNISTLTNDSGFITSADGADAATLDSLDSTQFLRSDANDTATGNLTFEGTVTISNADPGVSIADTDGGDTFKVRNDGGTYGVYNVTDTRLDFSIDGAGVATFAGNLNADSGLDVTGNITVTGTVDGRDVATDGTKLDGIEAGAEVNPTNVSAFTNDSGYITSADGGNAATLDSLDSTQFVRADEADTMTGNLTISNTLPAVVLTDTDAGDSFEVRNNAGTYSVYNVTDTRADLSIDGSGTATFAGNVDFDLGIDVTGNITVTGTVDGRDVAADGTKLDGIEAGATGDQTAAEILTAIKTVDGTSSGLDADTLDGVEGASFLRSDANDTATGALTIGNAVYTNYDSSDTDITGLVAGTTAGSLIEGQANAHLVVGIRDNDTSDSFSIVSGSGNYQTDSTYDKLVFQAKADGTLTANGGNTIWHSGNDGLGSGLDADLLDGQNLMPGSDTANSVVGRNASGDIFARLVRQTFNDQSTISGGMVYRVNNSTDNYLRVCNDTAAIRTYLGVSATGADSTYVPASGGTFSGAVTFNGNVNIRTNLDLADNDILRFGSGDDVEFFCNGSHMYMDLNSGIGNFYIRDGTTTRFTFDDAGDFTATGNVTAYSDINLKENIEVIPDALNKVSQLRGVTYNRKDMDGERQSGVIAQEVEAVLPEVVRTDEEGIKSVAYGNLVGLLIESIKELKAEVETLKAERN